VAFDTRPRLHNAAVERREASALRHWARDASLGVSRVPRWARSGAAFRTSASRRHTPSCARGQGRKRHPVRFEAGKPAHRGGGALAFDCHPGRIATRSDPGPRYPGLAGNARAAPQGDMGPGSRAEEALGRDDNGNRCLTGEYRNHVARMSLGRAVRARSHPGYVLLDRPVGVVSYRTKLPPAVVGGQGHPRGAAARA